MPNRAASHHRDALNITPVLVLACFVVFAESPANSARGAEARRVRLVKVQVLFETSPTCAALLLIHERVDNFFAHVQSYVRVLQRAKFI